MPVLHRYWFRFERLKQPSPLNLGCGVTAFSKEDAVELMKQMIFLAEDLQIKECIEEVDITSLDQKHIIPNMGNVVVRGIWFPLGFQHCER